MKSILKFRFITHVPAIFFGAAAICLNPLLTLIKTKRPRSAQAMPSLPLNSFMAKSFVLICSLLLVLAGMLPAYGQSFDWFNIATDSPRPSARSGHGMVYDPVHAKLILFGGADSTGTRNDVWEFDTATRHWTNVTPLSGPMPVPRSNFGMALDENRGVVVVYGGNCGTNCVEYGNVAIVGDTWEWNTSTRSWRKGPNTIPIFVGLRGSALAYDPTRRQVIAFSGKPYWCPYCENRTWAWDGTSWTDITPAISPDARYDHAMVTDTDRNRIVLFGPFEDTWEWDGSQWIPVGQTGPHPTWRWGVKMAYDKVRQKTILFGGSNQYTAFNETWEWDGTTWTQLFPLHSPPGRGFTSLVYDESQNALVMFGGDRLTDDTWISGPEDSTPPVSTASTNVAPNPAGWNNSNVTVTLNAADEAGGSGVQQIVYSASGAQLIGNTVILGSSASFLINAEGVTTITYFSRDTAGNAEEPQMVVVRLDKTPPVLSNLPANKTVSPTTATGAAVSYTTPSASDALDPNPAVACFPAAGSAFPIGTTQVTCTTTDQAGNTSSGSFAVTVKPPTAPSNLTVSVNPAVLTEGSSTTLIGNFADPDESDTHTVTINWGDGTPNTEVDLAAGVFDFTASHAYDDNRQVNAPYIVTTTVSDQTGSSAVYYSSEIIIPWTALNFDSAVTGLFGPIQTGRITIITPNGFVHSHGATVTASVEVHNPVNNTWTTIFTQSLTNGAQFGFNGLVLDFAPQVIDRIRLNSNPFQSASYHNWENSQIKVSSGIPLMVNNVPPSAVFSNNGPVAYGNPATVTFTAQMDPSNADTAAGFRYAFDLDNNGTFDIGSGTYVGSSTLSSATVPATYLSSSGTHNVKGRIIDKDGGFTDYTTSVVVNPPPDANPPQTVATSVPPPNGAGWNKSDVFVTLTSTDNTGGSGVKQIVYSASGAQSISPTTVNGANANFTISVEGETTITYFARDNAGNTETAQSLTIRIDKTAPVISNLPSNQTVVATGANGAAVSWSSPTVADNLDPDVSVSCAPASGSIFAHGITTVTCASTDRAGNAASRSFTVEVTNAPPTANAGGPYQVGEGGTVGLSGAGADTEGTALTFEWDLDDNGTFETAGQNPVFSAAGLDGPTSRTVKLRVTDAAGLSAVSSATVNVSNVAPTLHSVTGPVAPQAVGTTVNLTLNYTDPAGSLDTYTLTTNWGDGTTDNSAAHLYTTPGVYRVRAAVSDDDGGVSNEAFYEYVVVYDPEGGFVTGGGWIMSPAGAYAPNPALTGKANFGFVSKYQRGANQPTGSTEFQFNAGDFRFKSDAYEWLVVAGSKAQFKGTGAVNGVAGYRFILTATDGQASGGGGTDKFRIKVWNDGGVIYDNNRGEPDDADPPQAIGGGSIVIHSDR